MKLDDAPILERLSKFQRMCLGAAEMIKRDFIPMQDYCGCGDVHVIQFGAKVRILVEFPDQKVTSNAEIRFGVEFTLTPPDHVIAVREFQPNKPRKKDLILQPSREALLKTFFDLVEPDAQQVFDAIVTKDHRRLVRLLQ